ncbi:MAG: hypothetical protein K2G52_02150 [Muribaculaceae bacterium]|nr:hypothetical protein [Muribaculaceae bacterium]
MKLKKIQLIEAPSDGNQDIFRQELEEALGGWNCGSFDNDICNTYRSGICGGNVDYCGIYKCSTKSF